MRLQETYINYVKNTVNFMVRDSGFPVLAKSLSDSGIADRKKLKVLVRDGHLKVMKVRVEGGTIYNAYYTETEPPKKFMKQKTEGLETSEV